MTQGQPGGIRAQAIQLIDAVLADLAAGRDHWSDPEMFQAVARRLDPYSYRMAEDSGELANVPVSRVRETLVDVLGVDGYAMLLAAPAAARADTAEFMLAIESGDPCAVEAFDLDGGPDPEFVLTRGSDERLPLPFPYLLGWAAGALGRPQARLLTRALLDDLGEAGSEWRAVAACEPETRLLLRLRTGALDLLARPETPAQTRRRLEAILGHRAVTRLLDLTGDPLDKLADAVQGRRGSDDDWFDNLPVPTPDLPGVVLSIADWAGGRFGADDTGILVQAVLADITDGVHAWRWGDEFSGDDQYWIARIVAQRAAATTPRAVRRRVASALNRDCFAKLAEVPPPAARHLGGRLNEELRPSRWFEGAARSADIGVVIWHWARDWCAGDWWLLHSIEQEE